MRNILIVCSANICRSPMAEGIMRRAVSEAQLGNVEIRSAGTLGFVGVPAAEDSVEVCREIGVDISALRSSAIDPELFEWADIVLGMSREHLLYCKDLFDDAPVVLLGEYGRPEKPEIDDPIGQPIEAFRACRDLIEACVKGFVEKELSGRVEPRTSN